MAISHRYFPPDMYTVRVGHWQFFRAIGRSAHPTDFTAPYRVAADMEFLAARLAAISVESVPLEQRSAPWNCSIRMRTLRILAHTCDVLRYVK